MPDFPFFRDLVLAIMAALVGGVLAQRLGQPPLVGYLVGGIVIGPHTPGPVSDIRHVSTLADIGIVLLMFELGVEFPIRRLRRVWRVAVGGGVLQVVLTAVAGMGVARLLGFALVEQVFFGGIVALSSTAVALKLLLDRAELDAPQGEVTAGICLLQDLSLVAMLVLLPAWAGAVEAVWRALTFALGGTLVLFTGAYVVASILLPALFAEVARLRSRELFLLTVVLVVIGATVGLAALGLPTALGAYLAGIVVSRSHYSRQVLAELIPSRDLFTSLFFVSAGMLVNPLSLSRQPGALLAILAVMTIVKASIASVIVRAFGFAGSVAIMTGLLLAQVGELSFVLARLAVDRGFVGEELYGLTLGGAFISILINPILLTRGAPWLLGRFPVPAGGAPPSYEPPPVAERSGHVVICGCGRVGQELLAQLRGQGSSYVVIESNPIRIEELRHAGEPCVFGDAKNAHILRYAGVGRAKLLAITHHDAPASERTVQEALQMNPALKIIARAHYPTELQRLRNAGASEVVMPEFEAGMEFVRWALEQLGVRPEEAETLIQRRRAEFKPSDVGGDGAWSDAG